LDDVVLARRRLYRFRAGEGLSHALQNTAIGGELVEAELAALRRNGLGRDRRPHALIIYLRGGERLVAEIDLDSGPRLGAAGQHDPAFLIVFGSVDRQRVRLSRRRALRPLEYPRSAAAVVRHDDG